MFNINEEAPHQKLFPGHIIFVILLSQDTEETLILLKRKERKKRKKNKSLTDFETHLNN